jgi:aminomethyltransferase
MTTFGPWHMPVQYTSIVEEHQATRQKAGLFDTCHMGEIGLAGPGALPTLEAIFTRHVATLAPGRACYGFLTTEQGTVVDDCILYAMPEDHAPPLYILCVNAGSIVGDYEWIKAHASRDAVIENLSPYTGKIDLQGPLACGIINELAGAEVMLKRFEFKFVKLCGQTVMLSRSGYTGEDGYEIFTMRAGVASLWEKILTVGKPLGLVPAGLGARDTLRTEACLPLYGHELSLDITPIEAGFKWAVSFDKDFLGKDFLARQVAEGAARVSMPFRMAGRAPARPGYPVFVGDRTVGVVTSGTFLPSLNIPGGMCMLDRDVAVENATVAIEIRNVRHEAVLAARPLYSRRTA